MWRVYKVENGKRVTVKTFYSLKRAQKYCDSFLPLSFEDLRISRVLPNGEEKDWSDIWTEMRLKKSDFIREVFGDQSET